MSAPSQLLWHDPNWQKEAHDWIRSEANRRSIQLRGDIEQPHARPWSTVIRVPSDEGMLFFKASAAETVFEIALTQKLAEWFPDCMPELVAADTARGWMLMRDGGEQLRIFIRPTQDIRPWKPVITRYAEITEISTMATFCSKMGVLPSLTGAMPPSPIRSSRCELFSSAWRSPSTSTIGHLPPPR